MQSGDRRRRYGRQAIGRQSGSMRNAGHTRRVGCMFNRNLPSPQIITLGRNVAVGMRHGNMCCLGYGQDRLHRHQKGRGISKDG